MSSSCPKCQGEVEADFGLVTCPGCGSVLSVQLDGSVQVSSDLSGGNDGGDFSDQVSEPPSKEINPIELDPVQLQPNEVAAAELIDLSMPPGSKPAFDDLLAVENSLAPASTSNPTSTPESQNEIQNKVEFKGDNVMDADASQAEAFKASEAEISPLDTAPEIHTQLLADQLPLGTALADIVEFAESAGQPLISYQLLIEGVDLKAHSEKLKDVFKESYLGLDAQQIIDSVDQGRIEIKRLNPAQASVLKQKLIGFGFRLTWTQV